MDIKKDKISEEYIQFEIPPDRDVLMKMTKDELKEQGKKCHISRSQMEINDKDKLKKYLIDNILRLRPPFPTPVSPILVGTEYDHTKMKKKLIYKSVKHLRDSNTDKYKHSVVTTESYKVSLKISDVKLLEKEDLLNSIRDEVSKLNLDNYTSKEDIMEFACDNGKSNGEKRKRAVMLQKALQAKGIANRVAQPRPKAGKSKEERERAESEWGRHRITTHDISVY